ncbi:hypothetical protein B0H17DRAFT_1127766 [Mycena rosella]|uniref:Uncharacterized protein n=1 Tax=Mycena rosella TaxID=1033263 RepID=A0AAD7DYR3_MYCRO|nr:hypothetical protein B0H17DRAFT_1127766 [Mycena rosella]
MSYNKVPNTRSRSASATAPSPPPLPSNATPAAIAEVGYPDKEMAAKGKSIISSLHFKSKNPSKAHTGSNVKGKAREIDACQPTARSDNSFDNPFEPLAALEETSLDEELAAELVGLPPANMGSSGGDISSSDLTSDSISAPTTRTVHTIDVMKLIARKIDERNRAARAGAPHAPSSSTTATISSPTSPTKAADDDASPFLKPVSSASTGSLFTPTTPLSALPQTGAVTSTPAIRRSTATAARPTTTAGTTTTASAPGFSGMPSVALRNPISKALPPVALANPTTSTSSGHTGTSSSPGRVLSPTKKSRSPLAPATTTTTTTAPQGTPDPDGLRAASACEFNAALAAARAAMSTSPPEAARIRAESAAAQPNAGITTRAATANAAQPGGPPAAGAVPPATGATPSFATAITAPRTRSQTTRSMQPSGSRAPTVPSFSTTPPRVAQATAPHAAQPAAPHVAPSATPLLVQPTAQHVAPSAPPYIGQPAVQHVAQSVAQHVVQPATLHVPQPTALHVPQAVTLHGPPHAAQPAPPLATQPAPPLIAQPAPLLVPQPGVPPPAHPNVGNMNMANPGLGAAPPAAAHSGILAPIFVPRTAAVAAPIGNAIAVTTPPPPGGFRVFGWDEESAKAGIDGGHLAKWDTPGAPKALAYLWNARRYDARSSAIEDIKTSISRTLSCPAPLVGPAEPAAATAAEDGPFVYLVKNLTTAQFQILVNSLCWSVAGGKTFFVIPYSPSPCPFLMTVGGLLYDDSPQSTAEVATLVADTIRGAYTAQSFLALVHDAYPLGTPPMDHFISTLRVIATPYDGLIAWNVTAQPLPSSPPRTVLGPPSLPHFGSSPRCMHPVRPSCHRCAVAVVCHSDTPALLARSHPRSDGMSPPPPPSSIGTPPPLPAEGVVEDAAEGAMEVAEPPGAVADTEITEGFSCVHSHIYLTTIFHPIPPYMLDTLPPPESALSKSPTLHPTPSRTLKKPRNIVICTDKALQKKCNTFTTTKSQATLSRQK